MKTLLLPPILVMLAGVPALAQETVPGPGEVTSPDIVPEPIQAETGATSTGPSRDGYVAAKAVTPETLSGASVYSAADDDVGTVTEVVTDAGGAITEVIVDVGGFLGIAAKPVSLAVSDLEILQEEGGETLHVYVPMTRDQLEALPDHQG